jgi:transcriptional regulator with XRE-family HTH domain
MNDMTQIKNERIQQSMSQKRLALLAGIDARTLRKIEKGENVSPESYRSVCNALGIPPAAQEASTCAIEDAPVQAKPRSLISACLAAATFFALATGSILILAIYSGAYHFMNLGSATYAEAAISSMLLVLLGCPLLGVASIWASPNTVVTISTDNNERGLSVSTLLGVVSDVVPRGRFKIDSVSSSGSAQSVAAVGFTDRMDYPKLARLLTARGLRAEVRPA